MNHIDAEWICSNWTTASPEDRLAAAKYHRQQLRSLMTQMERLARMLRPYHPDSILPRVTELRAEGRSLREAVEQARAEQTGPLVDPEGAAEYRRDLLGFLDGMEEVYAHWRELAPELEPAWSDLEARQMALHEAIRAQERDRDGP